MRIGLAPAVLALVISGGCGSTKAKPAPPLKVTTFALKSKLMGRTMYEELVTRAGGGKRPLLVFLHGYGAAPSDTLSPRT